MKGVVVCPQPRAADVGAKVLADGGNAFDAVVAAAFSQMVNDPFMCGIGGMGTLHYFRAETGTSATLDFYARAGAKVTPDMWAADLKGYTPISRYSVFNDFRSELGYSSIMTPGALAGLGPFHAAVCTRPWGELLAPAIEEAKAGVVITPQARQVWLAYKQPGTPSGLHRLRTTAESARVYLHPEGRLFEPGEVMPLPDYSCTLDRLARHGWEDFYTGELADEILADLTANGATVTDADFAGYAADLGTPLKARYRGLEVQSSNPPGSGHAVLQILKVLDRFDLRALPHNGSRHLHLLGEAMAAAHADRNRYLGDPRFVDVPVDKLLSDARAGHWADRIRSGAPITAGPEEPPGCTTQLVTWDEAGNIASLTQTLGTTAGVVTPGLGFNYNNSMKLFDPMPGRMNSMAAGKARTTAMAPTIVYRDGTPVLAIGSPGGSVMVSAIVQAIVNVLDFGMSAMEAVSVPRIHCEGGPIHAEATVPGATVEELRALGHEVRHSHMSFDPVMGRATMAMREGDGTFRAGSDPRGGAGAAYSR